MLQRLPEHEDDRPDRGARRANWVTLAFAIIILTPSMIGFVMKFYEFVHTFQGDAEGAFAITPMVNYLLASLGFLCLLLWSAINGMFHDMEAPKRTMLAYDAMLDGEDLAGDGAGWEKDGENNE